jgi:hypothetical protein
VSVVFPESICAEIPILRMHSNVLCSAYLAYEAIHATFSWNHETQTLTNTITNFYKYVAQNSIHKCNENKPVTGNFIFSVTELQEILNTSAPNLRTLLKYEIKDISSV